MSRIPEARPNALRDGEPDFVLLLPKQKHAIGCILFGVDWCDRRAAALRIATVQLLDFQFLDVGRIRQHHRTQIDRRLGGMNCTGKAMLQELRHEATVINVSMG